ncbi:MAG TPA: hypothetical protein VN259_11160 [Xanthomonadales bacterium]|nr:hypothetical protein [Xanthomonadales bacterium]
MDMKARPPEQQIFHLTGRRQGDSLRAIDGLGLRPALLAPYRDLGALRHDFPLVLVDGVEAADCARPLSSLVDDLLKDVAPRGVEGERLRRHGLQLERNIRREVDAGARGTLADLWETAAAGLGAREGETLEQVLNYAAGSLRAQGEVLGCTQAMPARLLTHAWRATRDARARRFRSEVGRLTLMLSDILRAAFSHSQAGRQPESLKAALGGPHQDAFDFDALSRIVGKGAPRDELPPARRARLEHTLAVLQSQRFFATHEDAVADEVHAFEFDNCAAAAQAWRERIDEVAVLVKAISVAELEVHGRYVEAQHDLVFDAFDASAIGADDLARFPDYLVCIPPERNDAAENAGLMDMLSSGFPVKVLVQTGDLLEDTSIGTAHFAFGVRSARLATAAMGLGGMFVLQSASSNLPALRFEIARGLECRGPALFSIYAGNPSGAALPPYLGAAAAMQSRAFPAFTYDAAAGANWATRFSLQNNPQPEDDWPVESLIWCDDAQQRIEQSCAFTFADFVFCDPRHAGHFALVPRANWNDAMLPLNEWLALDESAAAERVPYLLAVDAEDALQRVLVDAKVMQATRRCLLLWHRLQEHGGVHDSHAERLLAREKAAWTAAQAAPVIADASAVPAAIAASATEPEAATPARSRDEAYIETARCPSCNECNLINDRMFAYDERKQAYIKDLTAGSYRQLVEAAESCQVAIIHPGKPRDPNEPGLEELLARAEPFR